MILIVVVEKRALKICLNLGKTLNDFHGFCSFPLAILLFRFVSSGSFIVIKTKIAL